MRASTAPSAELEPLVSGTEGDAHLVQFYEDDGYLAEVVAAFVGDGLRKAEPAVIIATPEHRAAFLRLLRARGVDVPRALERGELSLLDAREVLGTFMVGGLPDAQRFRAAIVPVLERLHAARRGSRIRAFGEMVDLLWREGNPEGAIRLESLWSELAEAHAFTLLCAYVMGNFRSDEDAAAFESVCRAHSHVLPSEGYSQLQSPEDRLRRISVLEQRGQALEHELAHRKVIEEALLEAIRIREDFLAIAGHELKTPLTAMQLQMDTLLGLMGQDREEEVGDRLSRLRKHTARLGSLVEDLLDVSRLSAGRFALELQEADLAEVLRDVVSRFDESAARAGCHLRVLLDGEIPGRWDRFRLEQVVSNLLTNALKYGAGHPIEVSARSTRTRVKLVVRDHGCGIPLADQSRIFNRFERASASRNYGGLGLGLWIVRQVVEAHGGTVRVESEPDDGATFVVELPLGQS